MAETMRGFFGGRGPLTNEEEIQATATRYEVFLSFRGKDTRTNFTDHLYTRLVEAGITTFRDDDEIERGEDIMASLQKGIRESKIFVIVFSKDYASSIWCLDELVTILERRRTGHVVVIPVFYLVDPSEVKNQTGNYAESFSRHEENFEKERVQKWRNALREVGYLAGKELGTRSESKFIQEIVREILQKLPQPLLHTGCYLVGLDSRVKPINLWLQDESNEVQVAIIYGIGGIGKTTTAKTVYNQNFRRFEASSFVENVTDTLKELNGCVQIQRQLLLYLQKGKLNEISNAHEGILKIQSVLNGRKVLIVLDDIEESDQLEKILGWPVCIHRGSKIIITTRKSYFLRRNEVCEKFEQALLDVSESLELLSLHAFGKDHPIEGYSECSRTAISQCGGLPLALKLLGSSLSHSSPDVWNSEIEKLKATSDGQILHIFKRSYDSLKDNHDKDLFLDIACFFTRKDKDYTISILDSCGYYTKAGVKNLMERCLLSVDEKNKFLMHQLIRDMGRQLTCEESRYDLGERRRLWRDKDAFTVLEEKTGTKKVVGLALDYRKLTNYELGNTTAEFETDTFMRMTELKLLELCYVKFHGDYGAIWIPKKLVRLCWHGFPLKCIPTNFCMFGIKGSCLRKLVSLDMSWSGLEQPWEGIMNLPALKFLNLSHCHQLTTTSNLSGTPLLEWLTLEDCPKLIDVDESIGNLRKLKVLNLKRCISLEKLPCEIRLLESLEKLYLWGCSKLVVPKDLVVMQSLKVLDLGGVEINQSYSDGDAKRLRVAVSCPNQRPWLPTRQNPLDFFPTSLIELKLPNCNLTHDVLYFGLGSFPCLEILDLSFNPFRTLPSGIGSLKKLRDLAVINCRKLQFVHEVPSNLQILAAVGCESLEKIPYFARLAELWPTIAGCDKLVKIEGFAKLEQIKNANAAVLASLGLYSSKRLKSIRMEYANSTGFTLKNLTTSLQVLHPCGISSVYLPANRVPNCFHYFREGPSTSFRVPIIMPGCRIRALNICVLFRPGFHQFEVSPRLGHLHISVINRTKKIRWVYHPMWIGVSSPDVGWLSF